ncbi:YbaK/EbsC family protein [Leekyejoonella antrihumi]|nr:YbaK/EbsC family protein [Leekyejoonella antrihumi]
MTTLRWTPALDSPELLAPPTVSALATVAIRERVEVAPIDPSISDTATLVERSDIRLEECANCVVVSGKRAGEERVAAVLVLASTRADINTVVRKHLDVRKVSFMSMDAAVERTGMEYGGITPLGLPTAWPVLIDARVIQADSIVIGSGVRHSKLRLAGADAALLPGAQVIDGLSK